MKQKQNFWKEVFSENGVGSSKRILGTLMLIIALVCITNLVFTEGGTDVVNELLKTILIVGSSLLGLSSVTSIWKKQTPETKKDDEEKEEE